MIDKYSTINIVAGGEGKFSVKVTLLEHVSRQKNSIIFLIFSLTVKIRRMHIFKVGNISTYKNEKLDFILIKVPRVPL